ncbi:Regulator of Vps4 activity in the MVB pathway protein [Hirschfeldia incana]|nr:Regulator of Vps4 activity in the MVB pathway protein [Hirschfeldia incana]
MGKKLDALLGRTFKTNKFKSLLNLALTRLSILKNQRQVRCSQATSDVTELLKLGQHENAYHRVDQVIKDQDTLDVLFFIHGYFTLLLDRVHLFEHNRDCPQELLEAVSSLLFAASRIGEFPELQEIRRVLVSRFGKDIAARSTDLRSDCGVNPKIIQKLSTRHPPREVRMKVLKEIAAENNIVLKLEESSSTSTEGKSDVSKAKLASEVGEDEIREGYGLSGLVKRGKQKYKDVADAAQAAFESAAHAAVAARVAVELSQISRYGPDNRANVGGRSSPSGSENKKPEQEGNDSEGEADVSSESKKSISDPEDTIEDVTSFREDPVKLLEKDDALYDSEEETKHIAKTNTTTEVKDEESLKDCSDRADTGHVEDVHHSEGEVDVRSESKKSISDTEDNIEDAMSFRDDPVTLLEKDVVVYDSEEETKHIAKTNTTTEVQDEERLMDGSDRADTGHVDNMVQSVEEPIIRKAILKGPISVRTRQVRGY